MIRFGRRSAGAVPDRPLALSSSHRRRLAVHHGLQLAGAVLIAYALALALGLPERFWVVITVLIVMRPDSGSTLDAGWDRVWGTALGAVSGLVGVALLSLGANASVVTLALVSLLAFGSAVLPLLRSAAVAALIILAAGELAGYSPLQAALLRMEQIGIGVAVSVALVGATSRYSTRARLYAGCAAVLGRLPLQLQTPGPGAATTPAQREARGAAVRTTLHGLAALASTADRKFPWTRAKTDTPQGWQHRRVAALTSRVVQDTESLARVLTLLRQQNQTHLAQQAADAAGAALASAAGMLSGRAQPSLATLRQLARNCVLPASTGGALLAAPLCLLLDDMQQLCGLGEGSGPAGSDSVGPMATTPAAVPTSH